jgi:hypothetical protein
VLPSRPTALPPSSLIRSFSYNNSPCIAKANEPPPNALSALDIHTYQRFQALCANSLVRSRRMPMLSMPFDDDDYNNNDIFLLLYRCHLSILRQYLFFFMPDSEFMNIEPNQVIPHFAPANRNRTFDLLEDEWC